MTGPLPPLPSLQPIVSCCNSRSTAPLTSMVLLGHKTQGKTMDRAFVAGLDRVTLQCLYVVLSHVRLPRARPMFQHISCLERQLL